MNFEGEGGSLGEGEGEGEGGELGRAAELAEIQLDIRVSEECGISRILCACRQVKGSVWRFVQMELESVTTLNDPPGHLIQEHVWPSMNY